MKKKIDEKKIAELTVKAKKYIPDRVKYFSLKLNVTYGRVTIRHQKTRWGSCSTKGNLNFNCLLMLTPGYVQDYVIVHELAHRKVMNHSSDFWHVVEGGMPDYKEAKKWLKENGVTIIQRMDLCE